MPQGWWVPQGCSIPWVHRVAEERPHQHKGFSLLLTPRVSHLRVCHLLAAVAQRAAPVRGRSPSLPAQGQGDPLRDGHHGDRDSGPGTDRGAGRCCWQGEGAGSHGKGLPAAPSLTQTCRDPQIGSYFGSEVCALDVDGDGVTDMLLVAAPMYLGAQSRETGRVYLYRVGQVRGWGGMQGHHSGCRGIGMHSGAGDAMGLGGHSRVGGRM